jgi:hypothetical protein
MAKDAKDLEDYAKKMGVDVDALKAGMKKYGVDEDDLVNPEKRRVLAQAIENKWAQDEYKAQYKASVNPQSDFDMDEILSQYGYSLGVLKEYRKELGPLFRWVAKQLQKGETTESIKAEFDKRLNQTEFGKRGPDAIAMDLDRYGASKKDFRDKWNDLAVRIKDMAEERYGTTGRGLLDEGKARKMALNLMYARGYNIDDTVIFKRLENLIGAAGSEPDDTTVDTGLTDQGQAGGVRSELLAWLSTNGVEMLPDRVNGYIDKILKGTTDLETVKQEVRDTDFTRKYEGFASLFQSGQDISDVALDYRRMVANILEKPINDVAIDSDYVRRALEYTTPDGKPGRMASYDFEKYLRSTPEWDKTTNAMETYTDIGETILRNFGFRG